MEEKKCVASLFKPLRTLFGAGGACFSITDSIENSTSGHEGSPRESCLERRNPNNTTDKSGRKQVNSRGFRLWDDKSNPEGNSKDSFVGSNSSLLNPHSSLRALRGLTISLREDFKRLKHEIVVTKREVVALFKDKREDLRQPRNEFTIQGYEIIQDFLDKDECGRLIQVANRYLSDRSYSIHGNCYLACRKDLQDVDKSVQQIINAQEVDDKLSQLFRSRIIEEMFERRIGEKLQLQSITIQVDNLDTQSKRGFHNDGVTPPTYKAFVYLNDVDDYGDGPYTVIPGSHRHTFRKVINYLYNRVIIVLSKQTIYNRKKDDRKLFYSDKQSVSIFGKAGTLIISNQQLAHKGWHKHDRNKRYALICYLIAEKHYRGQPFKLWSAALPRV